VITIHTDPPIHDANKRLSLVDPHWFQCGSEKNPAFEVNAKSDPDPVT
jgi:hypothetical protein